jgi:protein-S-isoprenylcysteine O-methyltransferase Ste14
VYFTILLVHRERRDNNFCHAKYGADWEHYCAKVRWRIIPGIY